jgi:hypothetical protein
VKLKLERKFLNENSTEGNLYVDGKWFCHVIEDKVRAKPGEWDNSHKVYAKTAIPYGNYQVLVTWSNRFKRMLPLLINVPDFQGIRIHNGRTETSSAGCLIVSYKAGKGYVINDKKAMNDLTDMISEAQKKSKVFIEIV